MAKIVVVMEGGLVQSVLSTEPVEVAIVDYDAEGADAEDLKSVPQGNGKVANAVGHVEEAEITPLERIEELFEAVR